MHSFNLHQICKKTFFNVASRSASSTSRQKSFTANPADSPRGLEDAAGILETREMRSATVVLKLSVRVERSLSPAKTKVIFDASSLDGGQAFMAANSGKTLSTRVWRILSLLSLLASPTSHISQTGQEGKKPCEAKDRKCSVIHSLQNV